MLLFERAILENLLIMIVEARQELEGPRGRRLHRVRVLIVGGGHAAAVDVAAASAAATSGTSVTDTGRVTTGITNAIDGGADAVAHLLPLHQRRYLLPF